MARAKKPASKQKAAQKEPKIVQARIAIDIPEDVPTYYVNYLEIAHNEHEFRVAGVRTPTTLPADKAAAARESGQVRFEPSVQLIIPPTVIPGLVNALTLQRDAFERENGPIAIKNVGEASDGKK